MASLIPGGWQARVDPSAFPHRKPGLINVQRYQFVPAHSGIATFLGLPLCLTPEDLWAGGVEVAVVGAPVDMGIGRRGAAFGSRAIRANEWVVARTPAMLMDSDTRINPFNELIVVDYGDAAVDAMNVEDSMEPIRGIVREVAETGAVPVVGTIGRFCPVRHVEWCVVQEDGVVPGRVPTRPRTGRLRMSRPGGPAVGPPPTGVLRCA
ncbi:arginase family protein [Streptosporangium sp. NPDC000396]|uniref:arginase family protein n=1 Tax=Streptosporangium sp. NPDC000396 TaxID=3366185 RepID=UPI0036860474